MGVIGFAWPVENLAATRAVPLSSLAALVALESQVPWSAAPGCPRPVEGLAGQAGRSGEGPSTPGGTCGPRATQESEKPGSGAH